MVNKNIVFLYVKIGYFFAGIDGNISEEEELTLKTKITNLQKNMTDVIQSEELQNVIDKIKQSNLTLERIAKDTKDILKCLDEKNRRDLFEKINSFIRELIYADDKASDEENKTFEKWNSMFKEKKKEAKIPFFVYFLYILVFVIAGISVFHYLKENENRKKLQEFSLSDYTQKILQFKEIDFSKVLIYGTNSDIPEKDSMLIYFVKGTANLRLKNLEDRLFVDYENTDFEKKELHLVYDISEDFAEFPIEVDVVFDENKCRLIERINAKPMANGKTGKVFKMISVIGGASVGGYAGKVLGGLFGMKGKIIGTVGGATLGAVGSYIFTSNFCAETSLVKDDDAETVVDLFEEAKPVIASQLLYDDYVSSNLNGENSQRDFVLQQITDCLTNEIVSDGSDWENVTVKFLTGSESSESEN